MLCPTASLKAQPCVFLPEASLVDAVRPRGLLFGSVTPDSGGDTGERDVSCLRGASAVGCGVLGGEGLRGAEGHRRVTG